MAVLGQGWTYEKLPNIVKLCFKSVEKYKKDYRVIRLDDENITDYIQFPEFIIKKKNEGKIKFAFFSDLLRLALLDSYGGVWLDATIFLTEKLSYNIDEKGYFMFQRSDFTYDKKKWEKYNNEYFSWDKRHKVKVLNSIIFSKKNNEVIYNLLEIMLIYWKVQDRVSHYFFFQILYEELLNRYVNDKRCEIIDDTLPHILIEKFNKKFSEKELK